MASFTALMNVVVDATEASKGLNTLDNRLTKIQKSSKTTSSSLSRLEKTFDKIEKSIKSVVAPIQKMESNLNKLVGKSMSGYLRIVQRLQKDNFKLKTSIKAVNDQINILNSDITKLNQKIDALEKRLNKLGSGNTKTKIGGITGAFKDLGKAIQRNEYLFYSLASGVLNFIKINLIGALIRITDQFILMENRIRLVNSSQVAFNNNMAAVKQIAQETRQSLYAIANLYSRVGRNSKELGKDTIALATTVSTIAKSFQIAGATAEEARNAIVQLSQALASGRLQGDELRSILELAPTLANSIAKSIGITLGSLRSFASEGLITTSIIVKAVRESAQEIDEEFKKIVPTISQSMTNIQNAFQIVLGETKEIKEANEIAALSFLKLAKDIEKLAGSPAMQKFGKFLKDLALSIDDVIIGLTAFIAILGTLVVVGVLSALFGGFVKAFILLGLAVAGAITSINTFRNATEQLAIPIRSIDEVVKDVNKKLDDNAEKTGEAATGAERAAAQFSALKTESYEAGLQIDLLNRKIADLNEKLESGEPIYTSGIGKMFDGLSKGFSAFFGVEESEFSKWMNKTLFGADPKEIEKQVKQMETVVNTAVGSQKKIDDEIKKRRDAQQKDAQTAEEEFVRNFLNTTERTNRRLAARFQEVRDAFKDSLSQPFEIRFTPAKKALAELNDTLRQKIGDIGEKRAKGSQLEFGGVGLDIKTLRDLALSDQQLTAANLGIKDAIASMLAGNKAVQDAGTAIPQVLLAEIEAATNEELLKFQEKILEVEKQMEASLAQRKKDQQRLNEDMASANRFASNELKYLKDGVKLHENKVASINAEYNYKVLNLKEDLRGLGYLDDEIEKLTEALEKERLLAIEAERIAKAKSDLLYIESELDKLRNTQFQLNMADKEYGLLKSYNSEYDRRRMLREEERRLLLDMKKIEWEAQGLQGEKLKQAQQIFEAQLNTEDSLTRQKLLLESATRTEQTRLDLEARSTQYQSEQMNDWAEKNRLDAFLMGERIQNLNKYNAEVIKATQEAGISVDFLKNDQQVLEQYGLSLLELSTELNSADHGIDEAILNNLRERIELLKEALGIENEINKQKNENEKNENKILEALRKRFPGIQKEGTKENDFASGIANIIQGIDKKSQTRGENRDIQKAQVEGDKADQSNYTAQLAKLGIFSGGGEGGFFSMFEGLFGDLMGSFGEMFGELGAVFGDVIGNLGGIVELGFDFLLDGVMSVAGILLKIFIATIENPKFQEAVDGFNEALDRPFDLIGDGLAQIFQGIGALMEPLYYIGDIVGGTFRGIIRGVTRVLEPIGKLFESLQPVFITIGVALQTFVLFFNQIFGFIGNLLDQIVEFISGSTPDGYKSLVLLKAERDTLQEIETALEGVVDVLRKIEDVLFDIVNSSLNLAAPSIKLENAVEQYNKLFGAASQIGATEEDIDAFNAFAKEFLQQAQDVLKSSTVYQDIYDNVIKDIMSLTGVFTDQMGRDVINALQKGSFDLKVVGSDIGDAIDNLVQKFNEGTVSFTTMVDYISLKLRQVMADIALRDTAEFGGLDIGREFERFQQMRGDAISSSSLEEDLANLTAGSSLYSSVLEAYAKFDATTANVSTASTSIESDSVVISSRTLARTAESSDSAFSTYSAESALDLSGYEAPTDLPGTLDVNNPFDLFNIDGVKLIEDLLTWIIDAVAEALTQIWGTFVEFMEFLTEPLTRIFDGSFTKWIEELLNKTFALITDGTFAKFIEEFFGGLFGIFTDGTFAKFIEELWNGLFGFLTDGTFAKFVEELFNGVFGLLTDGTFAKFVEELFNGVFGLITDGTFAKFVEELFDGVFGSFTDGSFAKVIEELIDGIFGSFTDGNFAKVIEELFSGIFGSFTDGKFLKFVEELFSGLFGSFTDIKFGTFVEELFTFFASMTIDAIAFLTELMKPIVGLTVGIVDFLANLFKPIENMASIDIADFLTKLTEPITGLSADITDWVTAVIVDPLSDMGSVDIADWVDSVLLQPLLNLGVDIIDYFTAILYPILSIGEVDFGDYIGMVLYPLQKLVLDAWDFLTNLFEPVFNMSGLSVDGFLTNILKPVTDLTTDFGTFITELFDTVFGGMGVDPAKFLSELFKPLAGITGNIDDIMDILTKPFENLSGGIQDLVDIVAKPFENLTGSIDDIVDIISKPFDFLKGSISNLITIISDPFKNLGGSISDIVNIISKPFEGVKGFIESIISILSKPFEGLISNSVQWIVDILSKPFANVTGGIDRIVSILSAPFKNLTGTVQSLLNIIAKPFEGLASSGGLVDSILNLINFGASFIDLTTYITDALKGLFGVPAGEEIKLLYNPFHQFNIGPDYFLKFAKGGQVPGGMLDGPSHREGGIPGSVGGRPIEMEGGEFIINKKSTSLLGMDFLSRINSVRNPNQIPGEAAYFRSGGKIQKFEDGTKQVLASSNKRASELALASGAQKSTFNILNFSAKTGGTIADIIGDHGIDVNLKIPEFIEKGKNISDLVKIYKNGGPVLKFGKGGMTPQQAAAKSEAYVTDQYSGDKDLVYKMFNRFGNDLLGRVSLELGLADRMTKPIFNASYEPPPWVPSWVKDTVEQAGQAAMDVITDPIGFLENLSNQIGDAINSITQGFANTIGDIVDDFFMGGGGSPEPFQYAQREAFVREVDQEWWPDNAKTISMIAGILNMDMLSTDIAEIKNAVYNLWDYWRGGPGGGWGGPGMVRDGGYIQKYETGGSVEKYPEGGQVSYGIDPDTGYPIDSNNYYQDFINDIYGYYTLTNWKAGFDALGGKNASRDVQQKYINVLMEYLIGGTAIAKSFSRNNKWGWAEDYRMQDYNPYLGSHQSTSVGGHGKPSGAEGHLWEGLMFYGSNFTNSNKSPNFMGGWENTGSTGKFVELFGDPNGNYFGAGIGSTPSYPQQVKNAGGYGQDLSFTSLWGVPYRLGGTQATIARFAMSQTNPYDLLTLNYNKLKQAQPILMSRWVKGNNQRFNLSGRSDDDLRGYATSGSYYGNFGMRDSAGNISDIPSIETYISQVPEAERWMSPSASNQRFGPAGMGVYANGGYVVGKSHEQGGVIAELEDGEFVIKKSAVDAIGIETLNSINSGDGGVFDIPKFQEGGIVVGRRDYDPLLAQTITEQYRNANLEGGTYEQVLSIYEALQGTQLNSGIAATLTEIFGTPEGFFDQINFDGITDVGITNSIIDGISDVFEDGGTGTGAGSYPVTVVSEPMYLDYMTRPLGNVIVTAGNYMDYMSDPLPNRIYQVEYLTLLAKPLNSLEEISSANYLNTVLSPLDRVTVNSMDVTEALNKVIDRIEIDNAAFNYSLISKILEMLVSDGGGSGGVGSGGGGTSDSASGLTNVVLTINELYNDVSSYFDTLIAKQEEVITTQNAELIALREEMSALTAYFENTITLQEDVIANQTNELIQLQTDLLRAQENLTIVTDALVEANNQLIYTQSSLEIVQGDLATALNLLAQAYKDLDKVGEPVPEPTPLPPYQPEDPGSGGGTPPPYQPPPADPGDGDTSEERKKKPQAPFPMNLFQALGDAIAALFGGGSSSDDDEYYEDESVAGLLGTMTMGSAALSVEGYNKILKNLREGSLDDAYKYLVDGELGGFFDPLKEEDPLGDLIGGLEYNFDQMGLNEFGKELEKFDITDYDPGVAIGKVYDDYLGDTDIFGKNAATLADELTTSSIIGGIDASLFAGSPIPPLTTAALYAGANPGFLERNTIGQTGDAAIDYLQGGGFDDDFADDFQSIEDAGNIYKAIRDKLGLDLVDIDFGDLSEVDLSEVLSDIDLSQYDPHIGKEDFSDEINLLGSNFQAGIDATVTNIKNGLGGLTSTYETLKAGYDDIMDKFKYEGIDFLDEKYWSGLSSALERVGKVLEGAWEDFIDKPVNEIINMIGLRETVDDIEEFRKDSDIDIYDTGYDIQDLNTEQFRDKFPTLDDLKTYDPSWMGTAINEGISTTSSNLQGLVGQIFGDEENENAIKSISNSLGSIAQGGIGGGMGGSLGTEITLEDVISAPGRLQRTLLDSDVNDLANYFTGGEFTDHIRGGILVNMKNSGIDIRDLGYDPSSYEEFDYANAIEENAKSVERYSAALDDFRRNSGIDTRDTGFDSRDTGVDFYDSGYDPLRGLGETGEDLIGMITGSGPNTLTGSPDLGMEMTNFRTEINDKFLGSIEGVKTDWGFEMSGLEMDMSFTTSSMFQDMGVDWSGFTAQFEQLWGTVVSELSGGVDKAVYSLRDNLFNGITGFFKNLDTIFSDLIEKATKALIEGAVMELFKFVGGLVPNPFYKNPYVSGDLHNRKNLLELTIGGQRVQGELGDDNANNISEDKAAASKAGGAPPTITMAANGGLLYQNGGYAYGPSHAQGGIPGIVAGSTPIEFEGGEYIINKKTVDLLGDAFFDSINSVRSPNQASSIFAQDGLRLPVNKIFDIRAQLSNFPKTVANTAFGFSGVGAGLNIASPGYFGTVRKNGGIVKYQFGDKVESFLPDRFTLLNLSDMLSFGEAATLGLLRKDGGPVKKFFGGGLTNLFGGAARLLSPPRVNLSAGMDLFKGPWTEYGLSWEEGGLVNPMFEGMGGYGNYGFGIVNSVTESSNMNAVLLKELIQTLKDKDLSVTVVDENGNKKDDSSLRIKRSEQLKYRNATELT